MTETMFESMAERLKTDISKEIAYAYMAFVPYDTQRVISKMKRNIHLSDRKFLEQDLRDSVGNNLIFPYDVLNSKLEKHISDFYAEFTLSQKTLKKLLSYGERGESFKTEFAERLKQAKEDAISSIRHEMNLQMMQSKNAKSVVEHIQKILTKRLSSLKNVLKSSAGQMRQYMVLWDYQDKGYTHYRIRTNGDNCEDCSGLDGKVFPIYKAESSKNLAPFHPNCDCCVEILDKKGNAVSDVKRENESKSDTDPLNYLQTSLKQIILGNFAEDSNLLGTLGQVALGFLGLDLPADIRDITYDITNFENSYEHIRQTLFDSLAVFPIVGGAKYIDEAGNVLKPAAKIGDDAAETVKDIGSANSANKNLTKDVGAVVDNYLKNNVNPHFRKNVKEAFESDAKVTVLKQDTIVYRYHGGVSSSNGHWYTPNQTSNPASDLALPPGNTYRHKDIFIVPKGTTILEGTVAPNFGQSGGGYQFYISDPTKLIKK
ncbi:MAG: minor capsid protein [Clostridia bacterium]|nr:minor capsid protein [Clostridia bacterium]